ncbi:unannotated protein [freshwater metagenome]|uniref:Unannotated protein n=1 Tax=freshwater metagenome TaxID=449393 RepID=A0A6J7PVD9_9ZZZZ
MKRSVGSPDRAIDMVTALGPGITLTSKFFEIASRITLKPGSLIVGIPASETINTFFPFASASRISALRASSLPSKKEITRPVKVTPISAHKR